MTGFNVGYHAAINDGFSTNYTIARLRNLIRGCAHPQKLPYFVKTGILFCINAFWSFFSYQQIAL